MRPADLRTRLLVTLVLATAAGCREHGAAARPPAPSPTVDIDLSPSGIGATIRGPEGARARAEHDHVLVEAAPDFAMEVHEGGLDPLAEKARIVRDWGVRFRRFVQDDGNTVIYETEAAGDPRVHFFSNGQKAGLHYHCRSTKEGAPSLETVQKMIVSCHAVTVHDRFAG